MDGELLASCAPTISAKALTRLAPVELRNVEPLVTDRVAVLTEKIG